MLNVFALLLCAFMTVKGLRFPSSSDSGTTGSLVYDYFWGAHWNDSTIENVWLRTCG